MEKKSVTLQLGQSSKIKVLNADDAKVKFISSNASVAKVSKNGKVTALKAGKARIRHPLTATVLFWARKPERQG